MARFSNEIQQSEVRAYEKFCIEQNIILDASQAAIENANLVRDYFTQTWNEVITPETLEKALPQLRPHLKFKSKAQSEFEKLASQEPDRASELDRWLQTHGGKPGQLVNSLYSDETYENLTLLLTTLRGYEINSPRIRDAENRIAHKPGRKLHYVQAPRRAMGTITEAARNDDGSPFLGELVRQADGSFRSKTPAEQRRDMEAAEKAKSQSQTPTLDPNEQTWKNMADGLLRDGTHSQQARVRAVYDQELFRGSGWRQIYEACKREVNLSKNRGFAR
jgi:hypothetical protein